MERRKSIACHESTLKHKESVKAFSARRFQVGSTDQVSRTRPAVPAIYNQDLHHRLQEQEKLPEDDFWFLPVENTSDVDDDIPIQLDFESEAFTLTQTTIDIGSKDEGVKDTYQEHFIELVSNFMKSLKIKNKETQENINKYVKSLPSNVNNPVWRIEDMTTLILR